MKNLFKERIVKCEYCNNFFTTTEDYAEHLVYGLCKGSKVASEKNNHTFIKYVVIGGFFTVLGAGLSTLAGVLYHASPKLLFIINFLFINIVLFVGKYFVSKKFGVIA
jgi:hypothetical protein